MAYTQEKKDECFDWIISHIEEGNALISALNTNEMPSSSTFYIWLEETDEKGIKTKEAEEKSKRYTRACEVRQEKMLEEILTIADKQTEDIIHTDSGDIVNHNVINRNRLQIDARKWYLAKVNPLKYGDKNETTLKGDSNNPILIISLGSGVNPEEK